MILGFCSHFLNLMLVKKLCSRPITTVGKNFKKPTTIYLKWATRNRKLVWMRLQKCKPRSVREQILIMRLWSVCQPARHHLKWIHLSNKLLPQSAWLKSRLETRNCKILLLKSLSKTFCNASRKMMARISLTRRSSSTTVRNKQA